MQEVNEAKQTKDTWVRGQLPSASSAGDTSAKSKGKAKGLVLVEGWLLAATTQRGAMMADAPDALAAQLAFEKQVSG